MAERVINQAESLEFLARRDMHDAETAARVNKASGRIYTPAEAAKLRGRGGTSSSPDGKPARSAKPVTMAVLEHAIVRTAEMVKAIIEPLERRIAELEGSGTAKVSMSHRGRDGEVIAELWERGGVVTLRIGGTTTTEAVAGTEAAKRLLAKFEGLAP